MARASCKSYDFVESKQEENIFRSSKVGASYVMASLDVAMFPNIPSELVKKAVSDRWNKIKSHTKLDEKEFFKGLDFIINSTKFKFKFNCKLYKQKFGSPISSFISSMLAEITMEDLEEYIFKSLGFVVPFHFRYVDYTLFCVPLDKLQTFIDTFNYYHPRIQFTYETINKLQQILYNNNVISIFIIIVFII